VVNVVMIEQRTRDYETASTLAEVADALGLSRQRVQQVEKVALRKLRRALEARGLTLEDFIADVTRPSGRRRPRGR